MTPVRRLSTRLLLALAAASVALLLGGCVYLRLLELKKQLGQFDRFFLLQTHNGVALVCQQPVLTPDDVRWIGLRPEEIKTLGQAQQWQVRWVKQLPPGVVENGQFDITIELGFVEGRLTRVAIPERYFAVMPKDFLVNLIKSLGKGQVDKSSKKIESAVTAVPPDLPDIDKLLGRPSEEIVEGANTVVRYRYVPVTKEAGAGVFDMRITFHTKSGKLLEWHGKTPVGNIRFKFEQSK
ncbi:MAG TPA: hypothetical protein VGE76_17200 [Opitutaceae bacterium]